MAYTVIVKPAAERELKKLERDIQQRILRALEALADNPFPQGCKRLAGLKLYRVRVGDYRIIYLAEQRQITVAKVAHRRDVYRNL